MARAGELAPAGAPREEAPLGGAPERSWLARLDSRISVGFGLGFLDLASGFHSIGFRLDLG